MARKTKKSDKLVIGPKEEYAYGYIINALSEGLYPNKLHVIREYIQNAFDAVVNWRNLYNDRNVGVKIFINRPSISIYDNGTGMDRETLNEYKKVGFSRKDVRESVGFRGIGKLAGISVAKKLIVTTSPYGVPEKFTLEFDAKSMIEEVNKLKRKKQNISLNDLIEEFTSLSSGIESMEQHYTFIELREIRPDSKILFNNDSLIDYISENCPVPFNPKFTYGREIEKGINEMVDDYGSVNISVGRKSVYKPYAISVHRPKRIVIWSKNSKRILGYCWYCENKKKGQIRPPDPSGLIYRYKNFAVGDHELTRRTLWNTSPHLAFYFFGEIYICDGDIKPTSQRDDFEQNSARKRFYERGIQVSTELNKIARTSSGERRAEHYVELGNEVISGVKQSIKNKEFYLKELSAEKVAQVYNVVRNIEKRKVNISKKNKKNRILANKLIKEGKLLLKKFEGSKELSGEYDITKKINLNKQAKNVYYTAIRTLKDYFINNPKELERIIKLFHKNLLNHFQK